MFTLRSATKLLRSHPQSAAFLTRASRPPRPSHAPSPIPLGPPTPPPALPAAAAVSAAVPPALAAGSAALGSLCGVGGAVFLIPGLVRFAHLPQRVAAGTSLVAVTAVAATSAASFAADEGVDVRLALPLGAAAAALAPLGAAASARLPPARLRATLGAFMLVLAPVMPLRAYLSRRAAPHPDADSVAAPHDRPPRPPLMLAAFGAAVGFGSGLLGISGGSLFTPLVAVLSPDAPFRAVLATSFATMIVPTSVAAASYVRMSCVAPRMLPPLVLAAVVGASAGSSVARHAPDDALRAAFAILFTLMGLRVLRRPIAAPARVAKTLAAA